MSRRESPGLGIPIRGAFFVDPIAEIPDVDLSTLADARVVRCRRDGADHVFHVEIVDDEGVIDVRESAPIFA
jgi:hypothetical protein